MAISECSDILLINTPYKTALKVKLKVDNLTVNSILDTGCSSSVISTEIYNKLPIKHNVIMTKEMRTAGKDMKITAKLVGPVKIAIGNNLLFKTIYVADIKDDMLLGLDILIDLKAQIDIDKSTIKFRDQPVKLSKTSDTHPREHTVAKLDENISVPPFSETIASVNTFGMKECPYMIFEPRYNLPILLPNILFTGSDNIKISLINDGPNTWYYKRGTTMGNVISIDHSDILENENFDDDIRTLSFDKEIPEKLKPMLNNLDSSLTQDDINKLQNILCEYQDVFASSEYDVGDFDGVYHTITTTNPLPITQPLRRTPLQFLDEEKELIDNLIENNIIEASSSAFSSPTILLRKKDGGVRFVLDYRLLNNRTVRDSYPLPLLKDCIDSLSGNLWFSTLDANMAYFQIKLDPKTKHKTAFKTKFGLFEFNRLPQGLSNSPSSYCRALNLVLRGLTYTNCLCYLDDICVLGKTTEIHLNNLVEVFSRFRIHKMKLKPSKCFLFKKEINYLGRRISNNGITLSDRSINTINKWKPPISLKEIERFMGLVNYSRQFIDNFAFKAEPLLEVLRGKTFLWGEEQAKSFNTLKKELISPNILSFPQSNGGKYYLFTDASAFSIGSELKQSQNGVLKTIAYTSNVLTRAQRIWCSTKRELFAILKACYAHRHLLLGIEFDIICDCHSLIWLKSFKNVEGILARWLEQLAQFSFNIVFRSGKLLQNADALSRIPVNDPCLNVANYYILPCGHCLNCVKLEKKWSQFNEQIDNVVSLATNMKHKIHSSSNKGTISEKIDNYVSSENILQDVALLFSVGNVMNKSFILAPSENDTSLSPNNGENRPMGKDLILNMLDDNVSDDDCTQTVATSCLSVDREEIIQAQANDPDMSFLYDYLKNDFIPENAEIKLASPTAQNYFLNRDIYSLINGVIYQTVGVDKDLLLIPKCLISEVLHLCHSIPTSCHQGITRTKLRVKQNYIWFNMSKDIKQFVASCTVCNLNKAPTKYLRHPKVIDTSGIIMNKVHLDFCGPFVLTERGNQHILVMVDSFSKFVECIPLKSPTAELTAQASVNYFFSKYGYPNQIVTDNGTNFVSDLFNEVCRMLRIRKSHTVPMRSSGNGQVERIMRQINAAIRCFVGKNPTDWDIYIPLISSALRASVNRHTGYTANYLMFAREINCPADIMVPDTKAKIQFPVDYVIDLRKKMEMCHEIARHTLKTQLKITKKFADIGSKMYPFREGQAVYLLDKNRTNKISPLWKGPFLVTKVISQQNLAIQMKNSRDRKIVNQDHLKPCLETKLPMWLLKNQKAILGKKPIKYCICMKPDDGLLMLQCQTCLDWFHAHCMKISKNKAKTLSEFLCPKCVSKNQK